MIQVLYQCPDRQTAADFLRRQRRNRALLQDEPVTILPENLAELRSQSISLRVGGPALIAIPDGYAGVTERNARFLRVLPPGAHVLGRFEYLFNVVDLRPRERTAKGVTVVTKEGIPLQTDVELAFRIHPGDDPVTHRRPFPYREDAVRKAAYAGSVGANGEVSSWMDGPVGKVRGVLGGLVSGEPLDNWIAPNDDRDPQQLLTDVATQLVWESLPQDGIKPLRLRIGRLTPPPEVSRQYTEYWLANRRKEDMVARANGTAGLVQEQETARSAADIAMLQAVVEGIRLAQQEVGVKLSGLQLTLHLVKALQRVFRQSTLNLQNVGGDTGQLIADINAISNTLSGMEERLLLPRRDFNPSTRD
jgi:regulator of protease activity HflC (stomatin/prohibitin superfamily)